ncbi:enolase 4-like isoform X2 [Babylonia areolata]|uniref:enolase 4-like isoform X2 n=1 Tax=Babylonia areolata TaxID=304850 RepID=UPI003FD0EF57
MSVSSNHKDAKEKFELKEKVIAYYQENEVPQKMEDILNSMFYDDPEDVYGHLANFFDKFTKPALITKLTARQMLDGRGQPTIQTQVFCKIKNVEKLFSCCISPSPSTFLMDNAKLEERETEDQRKVESVKAAISYIGGEVSAKLKDLKPTQQSEVDSLILLYIQMLKAEEESRKQSEEAEAPAEETKPATLSPKDKKAGRSSAKPRKGASATVIPEEPREQFIQGSELVSAVSQAVCVAGAYALGIPVYQHIANLYNAESSQLRMPLPMVPIMQSGKAAVGKLNCVKEFMIIPSPGLSYTQSLDYITGIYSYVEKTLTSKGGAGLKCVSETGALCPLFEKPEQGLDLLVEAITAANLTPGEDIHIAINAAAFEMFDFEKGRYEVSSGQQKTADDMVDFWVELMSRYPSVMVLIDPLRKQEKDQWMRLCDRITERCFVAGTKVYPRPELLKEAALPDPIMTGATILEFENLACVSDICACVKKMEEAGNQIILSATSGETPEDFIADLAVAMNVRFLRVGAPNRGERISKFNRLLEIESELEASSKLAPQVDHEFKHMALPPENEEAEGALVSPSTTKKEEGKKEGKKK